MHTRIETLGVTRFPLHDQARSPMFLAAAMPPGVMAITRSAAGFVSGTVRPTLWRLQSGVLVFFSIYLGMFLAQVSNNNLLIKTGPTFRVTILPTTRRIEV